jgi:hypothetical protein
MKNKSNSAENGTQSSDGGLVPKWINLNLLINDVSFFLLGLVGALIVGWVVFPALLYSKQPQPINFNHALHLDSDIVDGIEGDTPEEKCESCHWFRDDGSFSGIPKLEKCTECHDDPESPLGETPEEKAFLEEYVGLKRKSPGLFIQNSRSVSISPTSPM